MHDFLRLDGARDRQHLLRVQLDHLAVLVLAVDGEEVQHAADVRLVLRFRAGAVRRLGTQVVREFFVCDQGALGSEIEEVGVFLAVELAVRRDVFPRILSAESRLHVFARTLHVREHEDSCPRLHRHACRQLADGESDRLRVGLRRLHHAVEALLRLCVFILAEPPVACGEHDFVLAEHGMRGKEFRHGAAAVDAIQKPEGVRQLGAKLGRGKGELLLLRQGVEESLHFAFMLKFPALIRAEKCMEIKRIFCVFALGEVESLPRLIGNHLRQPVRHHVELRKRGVRVRRLARKAPLRFLFVGIRPVEDLPRAEAPLCNRLERRARKMECEVTSNPLERLVRPVRVDALVRLVDDEQIPMEIFDPFELPMLTAEIDGAFQPLQALEGDHPRLFLSRFAERVQIVRVHRARPYGALL